MTAHPLITERQRMSAELEAELRAAAAEIAEHRKGDIAGFVVLAWGDIGGLTAKTEIGGSRVPCQLIPQMVEEAVRQDILMRNVLRALASAAGGSGAS